MRVPSRRAGNDAMNIERSSLANQNRLASIALQCTQCAARVAASLVYRCDKCEGILEVQHLEEKSGYWATSDFVDEEVTLGEGNTPLRRVPETLLHEAFCGRLYIKDETGNPSGSFKDRLVAAAISKAMSFGARGIVCASSGNAGAAAARYAAHLGLPAVIVCPELTPEGKLTQIMAYGARLEKIPGHYGNSFAHALDICRKTGFVNVTTTYLNPYGVDALRLVGQEIYNALGDDVPDWVSVPTSSGPLVKGVFTGFKDAAGCLPRLVAAQALGCAPIARAFAAGEMNVEPWEQPKTVASGISDPLQFYPQEGSHTLSLVRATGGMAIGVEDEFILEAMKDLARTTGIFCEPTGATSLAAVRRLFAQGHIARDAVVVCIVTGHGFKDFAAWKF